jgi:hypothetical protein
VRPTSAIVTQQAFFRNSRWFRMLSATVPPAREQREHHRCYLLVTAQISKDSLVGASCKIGDRCSVKKSVIGSHCTVAANVKLSNCVIMDHVRIEEGYASRSPSRHAPQAARNCNSHLIISLLCPVQIWSTPSFARTRTFQPMPISKTVKWRRLTLWSQTVCRWAAIHLAFALWISS